MTRKENKSHKQLTPNSLNPDQLDEMRKAFQDIYKGGEKVWTMSNIGEEFDSEIAVRQSSKSLNLDALRELEKRLSALYGEHSLDDPEPPSKQMLAEHILDLERVEHFFETRTDYHKYVSRQREKTKRFTLSLSVLLVFAASLLVLYAPEGREVLSYFIGAALVVFAAGAVGFQRIWAKTKMGSFGASKGMQPRQDVR